MEACCCNEVQEWNFDSQKGESLISSVNYSLHTNRLHRWELLWHIYMHSLPVLLIPCLATKMHCFSKHFLFQIHFAVDNSQCCWLLIVVRYFKSLVHSQDSPWTFLRVYERQLQKGSLLSVCWDLLCRVLCSLRESYMFWIINEHETAVFPLWKIWCFTLNFRKIL